MIDRTIRSSLCVVCIVLECFRRVTEASDAHHRHYRGRDECREYAVEGQSEAGVCTVQLAHVHRCGRAGPIWARATEPPRATRPSVGLSPLPTQCLLCSPQARIRVSAGTASLWSRATDRAAHPVPQLPDAARTQSCGRRRCRCRSSCR